jgi:hypothetical protein
VPHAADQAEDYGKPAVNKSQANVVLKDWVYEDFFEMNSTQELQIKKLLATKLNIPYGDAVNRTDDDDEFGDAVGGIPAFTINIYKAARDKYKAALTTGDPVETRKASNLSVVASGCLIRWKPLVDVNEGYVKEWGQRNLQSWDSSIERRAAPGPSTDDPAFMYFSTTGASSLLALIAQVVFEFKTTGEVPQKLASAFTQIRLNICLNASGDEIALIGQCDNIEQALRKKHSEMDNILAVLSWQHSMANWSGSVLKPDSPLDVMRFACCLVDPRSSEKPEWLPSLLKGKSNTMKNRVDAMASPTVSKRWLTENKVRPAHPQMNTYEALALRHRVVKGFAPLKLLHKAIFCRMGSMGKAHMASPLPKSVLLDPAILTSAGFVLQKDKEDVPPWRDGAAGEALQVKMVSVAEIRYLEHNFCETGVPLFANGANWAAFARLVGPVEEVLSNLYGAKAGWPDSLKAMRREMWRGEHDEEMKALSLQLPGHLDSRQMHARVQEQLRFLSRKIADLSVKSQNAVVVAPPSVSPEIPVENPCRLYCNQETVPMTMQMSTQDKQALASKLNASAIRERDVAFLGELQRLAADVYRSRVEAFSNVEDAKAYMETGAAGVALVARTIIIDVTMPKNRQTGQNSMQICEPPSKELQRDWATQVKMIPGSPGLGHVLIRPALCSMEQLNVDLTATHAHVRQIMVPVDVPTKLKRAMIGFNMPAVNDASGVDFIMRTIGRAHATGDPVEVSEINQAAKDQAEEAVDEDEDQEEDVEMTADPKLDLMDPATMSFKQLKAKYGEDAVEISKMFFQHSSRIAASAVHLNKADAFTVKQSEAAQARQYRKGQLHPSAFVSAFTSALSLTPEELRQHEALVILTGGTPEAVVAGIAAGFQKVIYVTGDPKEVPMMKLPEDLTNIHFDRRFGWV